jgi:hypothetical protein
LKAVLLEDRLRIWYGLVGRTKHADEQDKTGPSNPLTPHIVTRNSIALPE